MRGSPAIPILNKPVRFADLPWGSVLKIEEDELQEAIITGPALYERRRWILPVWEPLEIVNTRALLRAGTVFRRQNGLEPRTTDDA